MLLFNTIIAICTTLALFIFSLNGFSKELKELGAERLKLWLSKVTANRLGGFLLGLFVTAVIQSSSAVTSIVVALVDAGTIHFYNSLAVLVGANVGTTFTAWLVAFKLDNVGSWLLVAGMILTFLPYRIHLIGKAVFYLGLILFSLQQINEALEPLTKNGQFIEWLALADTYWIGILAGMLLTALVQSSSVVTGLAIVLVSQGALHVEGAIAVVLGCNVGTTSTAVLASLSLSKNAQNAAVANVFLNVAGLLLFVPFIHQFVSFVLSLDTTLAYQVAMAHLIFNLVVALLALPLLKPIGKLVLKINRSN